MKGQLLHALAVDFVLKVLGIRLSSIVAAAAGEAGMLTEVETSWRLADGTDHG